MDTPYHYYLCLLVFILCRDFNCEQTCTELELQDRQPNENHIKVQTNSVLSLTVYLNTFNCQERWNWSLVRLSTYENGIHVDVCKVLLHSVTCHVTSVSSPCTCLRPLAIKFSKQITQEDNKVFIWKWSDSQSLQEEKQREITLFVEQSEEKTVSLTLLLTTTISCVGFVIIVIITAICVVRHKRHTRVRTSVPPTRVQGEEIHMYTALYPQGLRHPEETQTRVRSSKEMTESVGPRTTAVARENQPDYLELTDHPDDYLEPVPIL
ncbi:uncharacterized protein LOC112568209 isoform X1 [Pomacea canaliculata]|uniref:uncharacterized protein LOC112568209 isoform X1 n=1 Tax=Pomacea canaliculata TaxID=400727 RepID=UPI000D73659A|nr:uncharacterized protein LOC112568209 isoform X1 [Pomacea canaliculata]